DDLYRLTRAAPAEGRPQRGVPSHQRFPRRPQPIRVQRSRQFEYLLPLVEVGALVVEVGVEQQALLQRRQRPNVFHKMFRHCHSPQEDAFRARQLRCPTNPASSSSTSSCPSCRSGKSDGVWPPVVSAARRVRVCTHAWPSWCAWSSSRTRWGQFSVTVRSGPCAVSCITADASSTYRAGMSGSAAPPIVHPVAVPVDTVAANRPR